MQYAVGTGLTFVVGVMLARLMGATNYGVYALAMTSATLAGLITEFGLPTLAMRETGRAQANGQWGELRGLLYWADRAVLVLSAIVAAGFLLRFGVLGSTVGSGYLQAMVWGVVLIPIVAIGKLRSLVLMALGWVHSGQAPMMILRPLLFICGVLAVWRITGGVAARGAMVVQVSSTAVTMLVLIATYLRRRPAELVRATPVFRPREWLQSCLPMGMSEGLRLLQGQLALLMVGWLAGPAAAGTYRVADAANQMVGVVASVVATAAVPMIARLYGGQDHEGLARVVLLSAWGMVGGAVVLGVPLVVLGRWLFPAVFGHDFGASVPVFVILWCGIAVNAGFGLAISVANMTGHHIYTTQSFALIAGINVIAGLVLVPVYGAVGGACATAVSMVSGTVWCCWRVYRATGINTTVFNPRNIQLLGQVRQKIA